MKNSTVEEIRARFDGDVERFSNLETGQSATMDAPLTLELIAQVSAAVCPGAKALLDIGCGAGNYSLKLLQVLPYRATLTPHSIAQSPATARTAAPVSVRRRS